ncbi:putative tail tubular protein A [Aeromonas phage ZPAH7B]|uniref:Putative tail tubular protein A n=2 Tax=Aerosvirus ZPAH7 TaxID=2733366 RepID=A0A3Q9GHH2_9CAUD|nr:tail protein [Aeromonas phage ZPAH7]AZQ96393.1 putative tail tubular protein A [Aeromonas phage ZPAH7]QAX95973.1 putative tail tubular protein A [Aeromonas phage ZPAH7B]
MLTELEVVNACLATVGELPLVELSDDHPLVAPARQEFKMAAVSVGAKQWWFNTDRVTLQTANDSFVYVPQDAVAVTPINRADLSMRGRRLYNRLESTFSVRGPVPCWVIRDIPFDELPVPAQLLILHTAVLAFQKNYDADEAKTQKIDRQRSDAYLTLNAEHIRQIRLNPLLSPEVAQHILTQSPRGGSGHFPVR